MATVGTKLTLVDHAKRMDPNGKIARIAELLTQRNEILVDMTWKEGNLPTGHVTTQRTGLPAVAWRRINKGVPATKSRTAQITHTCGMLEGRSEIDVKLAAINGNTAEFRASEAGPFMESLNQELSSTLFYGNERTDEDEFTGLAVQYSSLSAENARNIVVGGGASTDNTSVWLVVWGEEGVTGIYPKGMPAGIEHKDLGEQDAFDADGNRYRALMDVWTLNCGLAVRDWRQAGRIPNISVNNLASGTNSADLSKLMAKLTHRIEALNMGKAAFYMNRTVLQYLDEQRTDRVMAGGGLTWETVDGKVIYSFRGIPIRVTDAIVNNESLVS